MKNHLNKYSILFQVVLYLYPQVMMCRYILTIYLYTTALVTVELTLPGVSEILLQDPKLF